MKSYPSGRHFEADFFGPRAHSLTTEREPPKLSFGHAFDEVKRVQPQLGWDPQNPPHSLGRKLYLAVLAKLPQGLEEPPVKLYNALGLSMDWHYHTDGVFTYGRENLVLIDLTIEFVHSKRRRKKEMRVVMGKPVEVIKPIDLDENFDLCVERISTRLLTLQRERIEKRKKHREEMDRYRDFAVKAAHDYRVSQREKQ